MTKPTGTYVESCRMLFAFIVCPSSRYVATSCQRCLCMSPSFNSKLLVQHVSYTEAHVSNQIVALWNPGTPWSWKPINLCSSHHRVMWLLHVRRAYVCPLVLTVNFLCSMCLIQKHMTLLNKMHHALASDCLYRCSTICDYTEMNFYAKRHELTRIRRQCRRN